MVFAQLRSRAAQMFSAVPWILFVSRVAQALFEEGFYYTLIYIHTVGREAYR